MQKIFISYNHHDKEMAIKVAMYLDQQGFEVIRDEEAMRAGENIRAFILRALKESAVTVSLVSRNSLLSAWVAMETVYSHAETDLDKRNFIPLVVEGSFFQPGFTDEALDVTDGKTNELNQRIQQRLEKNRGIRDLQEELQRYRDLAHHLDGIVARLKQTLCLDITGSNFESSMAKVVETLKLAQSDSSLNTGQANKPDPAALKTRLHKLLDEQGLDAVPEVLEAIKASGMGYNKPTLANLASDASQPLTALLPGPYITRLKSFINSLH